MSLVSDKTAETVKVAFGRALAHRMGWGSEVAAEVAAHVVVSPGAQGSTFELRWNGQGVVAGVFTVGSSPEHLAEEFAVAVESDLKMRTHRFGEVLP